jgi:inner membrane protein involved in colicin E2 resistance
MIYSLLRLEDNALLVRAISSFATVAGLMYLTHEPDWYGSIQTTGSGQKRIVPEPRMRPIQGATHGH